MNGRKSITEPLKGFCCYAYNSLITIYTYEFAASTNLFQNGLSIVQLLLFG